MTPETWRRVKDVFAIARELPASERASFLITACEGDEPLRAEVESLLAADETGSPFDTLPSETEARLRRELADRYRLERELGRGGMATVFLAHDVKHDRPVALKVLHPELAAALGARRFEREIRLTARLHHPSILSVLDSGASAGLLWFTMPYVAGGSLRSRLAEEKQLPVDEAVRIVREVAGALHHAHHHGVVHRDVKPENILLAEGQVLIADFGIARSLEGGDAQLTGTGVAVGTPTYMSPEQASGSRHVDARTDIYALGCVLFELLAGEPPYTGPTPQTIVARALTERPRAIHPVRATVSAALDAVIAKAMAVTPADRYASAQKFDQALERAAATPGPGAPARRLVISVTTIAALAGATWVALMVSKSRPAHTYAQRVVVGIFENRTGDRRDEYLGVMAADWITAGLQRAGVTEVVPTTTALAASRFVRQERSADPVRSLARETGAKLVITGSVYRVGDSIVIQAQLNDAANGALLGVPDPIRTQGANPIEGLSRLRTRLMGLLAVQLDERLSPVATASEQAPTFGAYQAFSEGMDAYVRTEYERALVSFRRAHDLDSTFVEPLLYASICFTNLKSYAVADSLLGLVAKRREELSPYDRYWVEYSQAELRGAHLAALAAIRNAALLAPGSKAEYNLAIQALEARQPFTAESTLKRLSPDRGPMRGWLPYWEVLTDALHVQGKHQEELVAAHSARLRFPDDPASYALEVRALAALRRALDISALLGEAERTTTSTGLRMGSLAFEAANELRAHGDSVSALPFLNQADRWFARHSSRNQIEEQWGRMQVAAHRGAWSEAAALGKVLVKEDPSSASYSGMLGVVLARGGHAEAARSILAQLARDERPYSFGIPQYEAARVATALGETEEAVSLISAAYSKGFPLYSEPHRDIALGDLRQNPLFGPVVRH